MYQTFQLKLSTSQESFERLRQLQVTFACVCNAIAPVVSEQRCWNRVALHHLVYRRMRDEFPELGSQMVCNAIYAVCKVARVVYQHAKSPFHSREMDKLPQIKFMDSSPVFFDWHTLSLSESRLSIFTLNGRIKIPVSLSSEQLVGMRQRKLMDISMQLLSENSVSLTFKFRMDESMGENSSENDTSWPVYHDNSYALLPTVCSELKTNESTTNAK